MPDEDKNTSREDDLSIEVLEKHILVNILEIPVAIVSNIYQTANLSKRSSSLGLAWSCS